MMIVNPYRFAAAAVGATLVGAVAATASAWHTPVNKPAGVQTGDLILLIMLIATPSTAYDVSTPSGFASALNLYNGTHRVRVFSRVADGSEGSSFTLSNPGGYPVQRSVACCVYRGATSVVTVPGSLASSITAASITPAAAGALIGIYGSKGAAGDVTGHAAPTGMETVAQIHPANAHLAVVHDLTSPAGATGDKTISWSPTAAPPDPVSALIQIA